MKHKLLSVIIAGLNVISGCVMPSIAEDIDLSGKNIDEPTLDYLRDETAEEDGHGNKVYVYPESVYSLDDSGSDYVITKYKYDSASQTLNEEEFNVNLKQTEYGSGDNTKYFEWTKNADGNYIFSEVAEPTTDKTTITVNYNDSNATSTRQTTFTDGGDIETNFIGAVYTQTGNSNNVGSAIYNANSTINSIIGNFIGNYALKNSGNANIYGGAIYNGYTISNITGNFIGNYITMNSNSGRGGAVYNDDNSSIGNITGGFIGNYVISGGFARGGAIYNGSSAIISSIMSDFIGNYASAENNNARGGAVYNYYGTITNITGDFIGNYATGESKHARGGAIYNENGTITNITGDFIGNSAESESGNAQGGAIYNTNSITLKNTNFIDNTASSTNAAAQGGAIYNSGTVNIIAADSSAVVIKDNSVSGGTTEAGGAIYNEASGTVNIQADEGSTIIAGTENQSLSDYTDSIHNLGTLKFSAYTDGAKGGNITLYSQICGSTGSVLISDVDVIASAITQSLLTVNSGSLTINMDNLSISGDLTNNSDLYLTGGTLARTILGSGKTYVGDSDSSTSETLTFANGAAIAGTLDLNDNTIAFDDSDYEETGELTTVEIGTLTGSGDMSINVDMSGATPVSDKLTVSSADSASLNLTGINVLADVTTGSYPDTQTVTYVDGDGADDTGYTIYEDPAIVYGDWTTYTNQYQYTFTLGDPGTLSVSSKATTYTLKDYIENGVENSNFSMTDNIYAVNTNEPTLGSTAENADSNDFLVYMNGYTITGDGQESDGFYVGSNTTEGQTLTLTGSGTVTDFNTAITVYSGNTLNLNNIVLTGNTVDIDNDGTTVLTGTNEIDTVTGEGDTTISSGTTTINSSLEQDTLTVNSGAELDNKGETDVTDLTTNSGLIVNEGTITAETIDNSGTINNETDAVITLNAQGNTNLGGKITNDGALNLSGENGAVITAAAAISGEGTTYINSGSVVNEGAIANDLDISDGADLTTNASNVSGDISNNGTLYYTGGTNSNTITGDGTLDITGDVTNSASVTQDTLIVDEDTILTNTSSITADNITNSGAIANDGTLTLGSGTTAEITGSGDLTVTGDLISTGIITQDNLTTNTGSELTINADNLDIQTSITNNGVLSLTGGTTSLSSGITGSNGIVNLSNVTINLADTVTLDGTYNVLSESTLNMANDVISSQVIDTLNLSDNLNWTIDVDLTSLTADSLKIGSFSSDGSVINISNISGLTDIKSGAASVNILSNNVGTSYVNIENSTYTTPIAKYLLSYSGSNGNLNISRSSFNPAILASSVSAQVGAYSAQMAAFDYAFEHSESFMPLPSAERFALQNANKYAITETRGVTASPDDFQNNSMWIRPYTSFESIPLKNGPDVDTISYGTLVGGDSGLIELKKGWTTAFTGYAGYNGSSQSYSGINTYQNGGLLGATQTFYKNNFFTALTASIGASTGESHNQYGHDNFTTLMSGIASKTGYNLEFGEGKFIIQPSMLLSYTFINTFDYTNAAGVRLDSDPLHAIQLHPAIRWYSNLENGWQPYASVGMVWNILDETKVTANDVRLPDMSIKPYVEYGLGIQRRWKDSFTGYAQAMVRNGGRKGIAFTFGFRWLLGKKEKSIEKV